MALLLFGTISTSQAQSFLTNGLVVYYPFNGNANDESGNGNDGMVQGATLTTDRNGVAETAYYFDGINNLIAATISNLPVSDAPRTISLWAKAAPDVVFGTTLAQWGIPDNTRAFAIHANGTWSAESWGGGSGAGSGVIVDEDWHHLVGTYDGTLRIFADGSLKGELTIAIATGTSPLYVGGSVETNAQGAHLQMFKGALDQIRIYNRSLSASEVWQLYQFEKFNVVEKLPVISVRKAVSLEFSDLKVGRNYQVQISPALNVWTNAGALFPATNTTMRSTQYWDVDDWNELFFRLQLIP